jgi:DNA-binding transcriptional LysR family regulator
MDLEDLRLLEAVAAEGSFSRAATRMRLSQPSVSTRIAALERMIGAELFIRDSRGARITGVGERYLGYVRRCLHLLEQGQRAAAAEAALLTIRVGVPASYAPALAPLILDTASTEQVVISIRTAHSIQLRNELLDGLLDLVFTVPGPVPVGITSHHAADSAIIALLRPPSQASSRPKETGRRFAIHSWGHDVDDVVSELLATDTPRHHISVVSPASAAISLALHRGYIAIVPRITATSELQAGWLDPIELHLPALSARLDYLYPTRHQHRVRLNTIGRAVRGSLR